MHKFVPWKKLALRILGCFCNFRKTDPINGPKGENSPNLVTLISANISIREGARHAADHLLIGDLEMR
jgi:hypothetical protein